MMLVRLLAFTKEITAAYERFDLQTVYSKTLEFTVSEVGEFYLDFSKFRKRRINKIARDAGVGIDNQGDVASSLSLNNIPELLSTQLVFY